MNQTKQAVEFDWRMDVQPSDLDIYGHVSMDRYLSYVVASRWLVAKELFGVSADELVARNLGFFTARAETDFRGQIIGLQRIRCKSRSVSLEGAKMWVSYEILSDDGNKTFAQGKLLILTIDLLTQRPIAMPDWVERYFWT